MAGFLARVVDFNMWVASLLNYHANFHIGDPVSPYLAATLIVSVICALVDCGIIFLPIVGIWWAIRAIIAARYTKTTI